MSQFNVWELARVVKQEIQDQISQLRFVEFGEVKATYSLSNGGYTAEVLLPGAGTTTPPLNCIASYIPRVGDWVVLLHPPGCDPMLIGAAPARSNVIINPDGSYAPIDHNHDGVYAPSVHDHDTRYYTKTEIGSQFAPASHDHNDLYYTKTETGTLLGDKAAASQPAITTPTLSAPWTAAGSPHAAPGYYKSTTGRVYLSGMMSGGTIGSAAFSLPSGSRPPARVIRSVYSDNGSGQVLAAVQIDPDGSVTPISGGTVLFSLDGVSFRV